MANITLSVSNSNLLTLINNEGIQITYGIERAICKGNSLTYTATNSDNTSLPSSIITAGGTITYQFIEDGLYKLTVEAGEEEDYYVRVTGNIETCERSLIQDIYCKQEDCDKYTYNQKLSKLLVFFSYKDRLYSLLNTYQQEQSNASLISIPEAERLTVCQYFCILKDMCGCVEQTYYDNVVTDCGCNK